MDELKRAIKDQNRSFIEVKNRLTKRIEELEEKIRLLETKVGEPKEPEASLWDKWFKH